MIGEIEFYKKPLSDYRKKFYPGQFFYVPIPFFCSEKIEVLELDYYDKDNLDNCNFRINSQNPSQMRNIQPIHEINIHKGEMIVCIRHKIRLAIAISSEVPHRLSEKEDDGNCLLVAPLYSTKDKGGKYKFSEKFLKRAQAYYYPNLFLLPEDTEYGVQESIVRFDRAIFVATTYLDHCPIMLNGQALEFMVKWFHYLTLGQLDETISLYRELLKEQYPDLL